MRGLQDEGRVIVASPGSLSHLGRRFFDVMSARPLSPGEARMVHGWLGPELASIFFDQGDEDQRHGYQAASTVIDHGITEPEVIVAALMHDAGKRHARLGIVGRTLASVMIRLGLPLGERMVLYRDHGRSAARELAESRAPALAIDYALHHHGERPPSIDSKTWSVLQTADQPANTMGRAKTEITSRSP